LNSCSVSIQESKDLLRAAGFTNVKVYGSFDARPYDMKAERLVVVSHKSNGAI
jgi:hypothetical protein